MLQEVRHIPLVFTLDSRMTTRTPNPVLSQACRGRLRRQPLG